MANDFTNDPNCVALWNQEDGALGADSIGTNTLSIQGGALANTDFFKQGAASGNYYAVLNSYLNIADAALDAGFPLKSGDTNKKISMCGWFRPRTLPASTNYIYAKYTATGNKRSIAWTVNSAGQFRLAIGHTSGSGFESITMTDLVMTIGNWYHWAFTYDDATRAYRLRCRKDGDVVAQLTGSLVNNISITDSQVTIAATGDAASHIDGFVDEVVVFKDILSADEIDQIYAGTYSVPIVAPVVVTAEVHNAEQSHSAPKFYSANQVRIRRFLRDPDGNIWSDAQLMHFWNDEQLEFGRTGTPDEAVTILRHPAPYKMAYLFPWEWHYGNPDHGNAYRALIYHRPWQGACGYNWEAQAAGINSGSATARGTQYTQPWEAYIGIDPAQMSPMWLPEDFQEVIFAAYDKDPLEFITWKDLQGQDRTFSSYAGEPRQYTVRDDVSNEFYLYPRPGAVWDDSGGEGVLIDADWAAAADETGLGIDLTAAETDADLGAALESLRIDGNVLLIYRRQAQAIAATSEEPNITPYLRKYIEYGVLAKAYRANTDGQIKSLADYWQWRKDLGQQILQRFKWKRLQDRNFQLASQNPAPRRRRGPRLPSTYPAV